MKDERIRTAPVERDAGFTLVEVLVSLAILTVLLSLLGGQLGLGLQLGEKGRQIAQRDEAVAIRNSIAARLQRAQPVFERHATRGHRLAFTGRSDEISFVVDGEHEGEGGGLERNAILRSPDGSRLILRREPFDPLRGALPGATESVIASGLASFEVRYLEPLDQGRRSAWRDSWQDRASLPLLIEMSVRARGWHPEPVVVEPRLR